MAIWKPDRDARLVFLFMAIAAALEWLVARAVLHGGVPTN